MQLLLGLQKKSNRYQDIPTKGNTLQSLLPILENIVNSKCILRNTVQANQRLVSLVGILRTEIPQFSLRVGVTFNLLENCIKYSCVCLKNDKILVINSRQLRLNFIHKFLRKKGESEQTVSVSLGQQNGQLQLFIISNYTKTITSSISLLGKEISIKLKQLIRICNRKLQSILIQINQIKTQTENEKITRMLSLQKIKRHIYFSSYDLGLSEKASEYRHPSEATLKGRQKIIKSLLDNNGPQFKERQLADGVLYGLIQVPTVTENKQWRRQFESTYYFQRLLQIPKPKVINQGQNIYIYNEIKVCEPEKMRIQTLYKTANSVMKVANISFKYSIKNGQNITEAEDIRNSPLNKLIMIKTTKDQTTKNKIKLFHQRQILKIFSSAYSGYLLKYYNSDQDHFQLKNCILMDYNPHSITLADHVKARNETLSLQSKLHLLAHISNGLRFFNYYNVVHMDLNLNNILVYDGYLPKIIDFGQAYNHQVVDMELSKQIQYNPGFTLPYCSPQVFTFKEFTSSQDIFSFGMIVFKLLANSLPYFPSDQLIADYTNKTYHSKFMFAPQKAEDAAKPQIFYLLLQLVSRCVRVQYQTRPLAIWATIILKQVISYLYS